MNPKPDSEDHEILSSLKDSEAQKYTLVQMTSIIKKKVKLTDIISISFPPCLTNKVLLPSSISNSPNAQLGTSTLQSPTSPPAANAQRMSGLQDIRYMTSTQPPSYSLRIVSPQGCKCTQNITKVSTINLTNTRFIHCHQRYWVVLTAPMQGKPWKAAVLPRHLQEHDLRMKTPRANR